MNLNLYLLKICVSYLYQMAGSGWIPEIFFSPSKPSAPDRENTLPLSLSWTPGLVGGSCKLSLKMLKKKNHRKNSQYILYIYIYNIYVFCIPIIAILRIIMIVLYIYNLDPLRSIFGCMFFVSIFLFQSINIFNFQQPKKNGRHNFQQHQKAKLGGPELLPKPKLSHRRPWSPGRVTVGSQVLSRVKKKHLVVFGERTGYLMSGFEGF